MSRSYTSAKREHLGEKPSFELDGVKFQCEGGITTLDMAEMAKAATQGLDTDDVRAIAVFADFFSQTLGDTEYARFRKHTRDHGTDPEVFVDILQGLAEDFFGRPTEEPSSSQDGPSTTGPMSKVVSLQRGSIFLGEPGSRAAAAVSSPSAPASSSPSSLLYG